MHAPDRHLLVKASVYALQAQRAVADAGRWAPSEGIAPTLDLVTQGFLVSKLQMVGATMKSTKRPIGVWIILVLYSVSLVWSMRSLWLAYTERVPASDATAEYLQNLVGLPAR